MENTDLSGVIQLIATVILAVYSAYTKHKADKVSGITDKQQEMLDKQSTTLEHQKGTLDELQSLTLILQNQVARLTEENRGVKTVNDELQNQLHQKDVEIATLRNDMAKPQNDLTGLKEQVNLLRSRISMLEGILKANNLTVPE